MLRALYSLVLCLPLALPALSHARKGADVIIAQGYEAGGHTGTIGNFPLVAAEDRASAGTPPRTRI